MKRFTLILLFLCSCIAETVPDDHDDPDSIEPDPEEMYCPTIDNLRDRLWRDHGVATLSCETDDDCKTRVCVCGGCGT